MRKLISNSLRKSLALVGLVFVMVVAVSAANPVPYITGPVNPQAVAPGSGAFNLTVRGVNFVSGAVVNWNGSARSTTFVSSDELQAQILASDIATPSAGYITVTNPGGVKSSSSYATVEVAQPISVPAFDHPHHYGSGSIWSAAVADFNHDGVLDLLLGGGSGIVSLIPGQGDGTFGQDIAHLHGREEPFVAFGNFNADDNLDFAYVGGLHAINEHAHIVLANGDGTFSKFGRYGKLTPYSHPTIIADLNRDGSLDSAILDAPGKVLLGNGDGSFQPQIKFDAFGGWALAAADFDGDGNLDLAGFGQDGSNAAIGLMLGKGEGTFQQPVIVMSGTKLGGTTLQVSDLNGDGKADLVFIAAHVGVGILFGNGDGTFQAPTYVSSGCGSRRFLGFAAQDFNSDGKTDLGISCYGVTNTPNRFSFLAGNGDGTFQSPVFVHLPLGIQTTRIVPGDFNSDGRVDMGIIPGGNAIWIYTQK